MICYFFPGYPFRGVKAPYLWFFYKVLSADPEQKKFIIGKEYLEDFSGFGERWELTKESQKKLNYNIPKLTDFEKHQYFILTNKFFENNLSKKHNNPLKVFRQFLTERDVKLELELKELLDSVGEIEAIVTPLNCPSLEAVAKKRKIPVIHIELGPLREPRYLDTGYFDFSGVNGNSEAEAIFNKNNEKFLQISQKLLNDFSLLFKKEFQKKIIDVGQNTGIVLQVDDDSNLIAFGNGFDNISLIRLGLLQRKESSIIIRSHPGSLFQISPTKLFEIDQSLNSNIFLSKCKEILTINSSVGFEAILKGISVTILGDASYKFIRNGSEKEKRAKLFCYLFVYLVPLDLVFDPQYMKFRLSNPTIEEIMVTHVNYYLTNKIDSSLNGSSLEFFLSEALERVVKLKPEKIASEHEKYLQIKLEKSFLKRIRHQIKKILQIRKKS